VKEYYIYYDVLWNGHMYVKFSEDVLEIYSLKSN